LVSYREAIGEQQRNSGKAKEKLWEAWRSDEETIGKR